MTTQNISATRSRRSRPRRPASSSKAAPPSSRRRITLRQTQRSRPAPIRIGAKPVLVGAQDFSVHEERGRLVYQDEEGLLDLPRPRLAGRHQFINAGTAIAALRAAGIRAVRNGRLRTRHGPRRMAGKAAAPRERPAPEPRAGGLRALARRWPQSRRRAGGFSRHGGSQREERRAPRPHRRHAGNQGLPTGSSGTFSASRAR